MEEVHPFNIQLTETEKRYFGDLFVCCDSDNTGKIPLYKASEFFRSANLPLDVLKQITDLCGGGRNISHLSRRQFYSALKLIAAFQAGLTLRPELFQSALEVPLPRFTWPNTFETWETQHIAPNPTSPDLIQLNDTDKTPSLQQDHIVPNEEMEIESSRPNGGSISPPMRLKVGSPEASSTASDSPTPTNSIQDKNWATNTHWQALVCEEQRQLLGTEEESSDRHSSEDDADSEIWVITDEQREYYTAQFRSLQPDPTGLLVGPIARLFFEKSRLPVQELRKIWQLSDVTKDGALSLAEFNTAMHLVVLRRNNIDLPETLPPSLVPSAAPIRSGPPEESPPSLSPPTGEPASPPRSKEWTKFVDSPTSSVSSPGPKPVNFDFHKSAVEQDPKILHPVPLRVTPESQGLPTNEEEPCRSPRKLPETQPIPYEHLGRDEGSPKKGTDNNVTQAASDIRPIQRPQPKKPAAPGPGAIPPPPQPTALSLAEAEPQPGSLSGPTSLPAPQMGPKKEPPPPPPPRPYRTHTRSSSLDLNRLGKSSGLLGAPPTVPPRVSPSTTSPKKLIGQRSEGDVLSLAGVPSGFADFAQFGQEEDSVGDGSQPRRHGAFEVYRKPLPRSGAVEPESPTDELERLGPGPVTSLRRLRERNLLLVRVCQELNRELAEVREERTLLELQLEQLKMKPDADD